MQQLIKILGVALLCAVIVMLLRSVGGMADMARAASVLILSGAVILLISPALELVLGISSDSGAGKYISLMLKSLCISYLVHICASICRDSGEASIAGYIELVGKIEIILLSLPLIEEIVGISKEIVELV